MGAQLVPNDLVKGFRSQVQWVPIGDEINPFKKYKPFRPFIYAYNTRRMNGYISRELDQRSAMRRNTEHQKFSKRSKPIIDIALDVYLEDENRDSSTDDIDPTFKSFAIDQIKLFMFAGTFTIEPTNNHTILIPLLCSNQDV